MFEFFSWFLNTGARAPTSAEHFPFLPAWWVMDDVVWVRVMITFRWLYFNLINRHHPKRWVAVVPRLNYLILAIDLWGFIRPASHEARHQPVAGFILRCDYLRGAFNKIPYFFVQAFKIIKDSWKFSMLLLYILWDDWPILMISASDEQLQQQLEYTILKPDCHSWWISKMQSGREDTLEERYAIKFCFELEKNTTETYGMLQNAFWPSCMNRA